MKVYVVTDNSGLDYEGDSYCVVGIFTSKEKALDGIKEYFQLKDKAGDDITLLPEIAIEDIGKQRQFNYCDGWSDYSFIDIEERELDVVTKFH